MKIKQNQIWLTSIKIIWILYSFYSTTLKPEENVLSSSKPSSGVKDLVKHKNLTQLERKNVTSEINSIFSKKVKKKPVETASSVTKSTIQHPVCSVISRTEKEEKPKKKKHKLIESSTVSIGSWGKKRVGLYP